MFLSLLRRKDIDENSTQKLHSAVAINSVLSLIYQAVCEQLLWQLLLLPVVLWMW